MVRAKAARPPQGAAAGRLTAEAVLARNLSRDIEIVMPLGFLIAGGWGGGWSGGVIGLAAAIWLALFLFFPFLNGDPLRAGDLVAGSWVVKAERRRLAPALSTRTPAVAEYRFGPAALSVHGEHELQALGEVAAAICGKIGPQAEAGDERAFLTPFYAGLRAHLERGMRLGHRKASKHE